MTMRMDGDHRAGSRRVSQAAQQRLAESCYPSVQRVSCEFDEGTLYLRGRVSCFYHKQLAQEAVASLDGIARVVNQVEVAEI